MPYKIEKRGKQFCVVKADGSGKTFGCHPTHAEAVKQLQALHANVHEKEDVDYVNLIESI